MHVFYNTTFFVWYVYNYSKILLFLSPRFFRKPIKNYNKMKRLFTLFTMLATIVIVNAQQLPNSDFEQWSGGKPVGWSGLEYMGFPLGTNPIVQSSNSHSGKAMQVSSSALNPLLVMFLPDSMDYLRDMAIPGIATNGVLDVLGLVGGLSAIAGGEEIDLLGMADYITNGLTIDAGHRPSKISGYGFSVQGGTDMCMIVALVYSNDGGTRHMIGVGATAPDEATAPTAFEMPIEYYSNETANELIVLTVVMSLEQEIKAYSSITIDDLFVDYTLDIAENSTHISAVYPNPAYNYVQIKTVNQNPCEVQIIDLLGKTVLYLPAVSSDSKVDISNLKQGIYFLKMAQDKQTTTQKLIIQ
jgi:hypothetical protein